MNKKLFITVALLVGQVLAMETTTQHQSVAENTATEQKLFAFTISQKLEIPVRLARLISAFDMFFEDHGFLEVCLSSLLTLLCGS